MSAPTPIVKLPAKIVKRGPPHVRRPFDCNRQCSRDGFISDTEFLAHIRLIHPAAYSSYVEPWGHMAYVKAFPTA